MMMMTCLALTLMGRRRAGPKQQLEGGSGGSREMGMLSQLQQQEVMSWLMRMQAMQLRVAAVQSYQKRMARVLVGVQGGQ
jgi:hypothetical protein